MNEKISILDKTNLNLHSRDQSTVIYPLVNPPSEITSPESENMKSLESINSERPLQTNHDYE